METNVLDALVGLLQQRMKEDGFPSGTPQGPYMHGPGGLFGVPGIERDLISTRVQPRGIASMLPVRGTVDMNPLFGYITGFLEETGDVPDGVCDDPQTAGAIKACLQTAFFGRYSYQTRELELNRLGQRTNRGEFLDLRVINDPLLETGGNDITVPSSIGGGLNLNRDMLERMLEVGISFQNKLIRQVYTGNPSNSTGGGGYAEFPGLDILIGTNKFDAQTGQACPSLASDIKNFNYGNVNAQSNGTDIVQVITYLYRYIQSNAERMNFGETRWSITMRRTLFWEITAVWPCAYLTARCVFIDGNDQARVNVNANDQIAMRDAMRNGRYLLIDGERVEVILDDGIVEETSGDTNRITNGSFASDIYFIPRTVRGGLAVTYMEYLDYSRGAMIGAEEGRYSPYDFWTDGGRYLWHKKPPVNWCVQLLAKIEPRLILLTPHLAGRVQNVQYSPLQHERDALPDDPYYINGGVTSRVGPSYYSDWNPPT